MAMNISCKFEKASYNIFFVRAVTVKSLYTLWRRRRHRRNEVRSIVSTGCYPVDTIRQISVTFHRIMPYFVALSVKKGTCCKRVAKENSSTNFTTHGNPKYAQHFLQQEYTHLFYVLPNVNQNMTT